MMLDTLITPIPKKPNKWQENLNAGESAAFKLNFNRIAFMMNNILPTGNAL